MYFHPTAACPAIHSIPSSICTTTRDNTTPTHYHHLCNPPLFALTRRAALGRRLEKTNKQTYVPFRRQTCLVHARIHFHFANTPSTLHIYIRPQTQVGPPIPKCDDKKTRFLNSSALMLLTIQQNHSLQPIPGMIVLVPFDLSKFNSNHMIPYFIVNMIHLMTPPFFNMQQGPPDQPV